MTKRAQITDALVTELKEIPELYNNVHNRLKFWNEVNDFPYVCVVAGSENREYHPSNQIWGFLNIAIKLYTKSEEDSQSQLETVLALVEDKINALKGRLAYTTGTTAEIDVLSIITDEGLLNPYSVGEILINVRYDL